jgi:hypothetical protein
MGKPSSRQHLHQGAPEWVFQWRQSMGSPLHKWVAILMVGGGFAFFLTSVRIRVVPPTPWATHKASVIHVTDDAEGRMLTLRAREGGPFPSRFEPSAWDGAAAMERSAFEAARWTPPAYIPELRNLPDEVTPPVPLAVKGERILPKLRPESVAAPVAVKLRPTPELYPLSGITAAAMPRELPPFDGAIDAPLAAEPWRFLIRVDAAGNVRDCVSLAGGDDAGPSPLVAWLRRVSFPAEPAKPARWIAIGVGFANQPADGPDAR